MPSISHLERPGDIAIPLQNVKVSQFGFESTFIGANLSEPHTSMTPLSVYLARYAFLDWSLNVKLISNERIHKDRSCMNAWSMWRLVEGYCQSALSVTQYEDDWSWTTHGSLCMLFYKLSQLWSMTGISQQTVLTHSMHSGWSCFRYGPCFYNSRFAYSMHV